MPNETAPTEPGIALCLSGGGYRAMLFHLGALLRLDDDGLLARLTHVSSVSGGSIAAATLGISWSQLDFDEQGRARALRELVVDRLRRLSDHTLHRRAVFTGIFSPMAAGRIMAGVYRKRLFGDATLQALPDPAAAPRFVICATSVQTGGLWQLERDRISEYHVGTVRDVAMPLARAVGASAGFPPILGPLVTELDPDAFEPDTGLGYQTHPYDQKAMLGDGGIYDNLGLQPVERVETVLVSDGGAHIAPVPWPKTSALSQYLRVHSLMESQVGALRKRHLIADYESGRRAGTYWGIGTKIANYGLADALPAPVEATERLAHIPTRLGKLPPAVQEQLVNWGYAVCDAALRSHTDLARHVPTELPYPDRGVG